MKFQIVHLPFHDFTKYLLDATTALAVSGSRVFGRLIYERLATSIILCIKYYDPQGYFTPFWNSKKQEINIGNTVSPSIFKFQNVRAVLTYRNVSPHFGNLINWRTSQATKENLQN